MRAPSTLAFFLAHRTADLIFGGAMVALAIWYLATTAGQPELPPNPHFSSPFSALADPLAWLALLIGALILVHGWMRASSLRRGG